eukprot:TRINITY_DN3361_c0_g1_i3.p1 TRINITY_DN3361_c0_g1~~TRINITY_DN3361_c0_g1_i3.p1  ORF type:complete len:217 (+),score=29.75 TRINITY_DN3361_c0_g1_i3:52-702(+)
MREGIAASVCIIAFALAASQIPGVLRQIVQSDAVKQQADYLAIHIMNQVFHGVKIGERILESRGLLVMDVTSERYAGILLASRHPNVSVVTFYAASDKIRDRSNLHGVSSQVCVCVCVCCDEHNMQIRVMAGDVHTAQRDEGRFDIIICDGVDIVNKRWLARARALLRSGGMVAIGTTSVVDEATKEIRRSLTASGFGIVQLKDAMLLPVRYILAM